MGVCSDKGYIQRLGGKPPHWGCTPILGMYTPRSVYAMLRPACPPSICVRRCGTRLAPTSICVRQSCTPTVDSPRQHQQLRTQIAHFSKPTLPYALWCPPLSIRASQGKLCTGGSPIRTSPDKLCMRATKRGMYALREINCVCVEKQSLSHFPGGTVYDGCVQPLW